jgi:hypothetical protein
MPRRSRTGADPRGRRRPGPGAPLRSTRAPVSASGTRPSQGRTSGMPGTRRRTGLAFWHGGRGTGGTFWHTACFGRIGGVVSGPAVGAAAVPPRSGGVRWKSC